MSDSDEELLKKEEERLARLQQKKGNKYSNAVAAAKFNTKPATPPQATIPPPSPPPQTAIPSTPPPQKQPEPEIDPQKAKEDFEARQKQFMTPAQKARSEVISEMTPKVKKESEPVSPHVEEVPPPKKANFADLKTQFSKTPDSPPAEEHPGTPKKKWAKPPTTVVAEPPPPKESKESKWSKPPSSEPPSSPSPPPPSVEPETLPSPKKANFADLKNQFSAKPEEPSTPPVEDPGTPKKKWTKPPTSVVAEPPPPKESKWAISKDEKPADHHSEVHVPEHHSPPLAHESHDEPKPEEPDGTHGSGSEKFNRPVRAHVRPATQPVSNQLGNSGPKAPIATAGPIGSLAAIGGLVSLKAQEKKKVPARVEPNQDSDGEFGKKTEEVFEHVRVYTAPSASAMQPRTMGFGAFDVAAARNGLKKADGVAGDPDYAPKVN